MNIPIDKLKHFLVGAILGFIFININIWGGFIFVVIVLAGKEIIWDWKFKKGNPELMDFIYGVIPTIMFLITKLL